MSRIWMENTNNYFNTLSTAAAAVLNVMWERNNGHIGLKVKQLLFFGFLSMKIVEGGWTRFLIELKLFILIELTIIA